MKILYVITKSSWGGAQKYVYDLASSLDKEKFDVAVACGGNGLLKDKLEQAGIRIITIPFLQRDINIIKEFLSLFSLIKIFKKERPDIVHLNSTKIGGLGAVAARSLRLYGLKPKIIFTAHGWGFNEDRALPARVIIFFAQWLTVLFSDAVICVSQAVYRQGMYFPLSRGKLRIADLGIKTSDYAPGAEAKKRVLGLLTKTNPINTEFPVIGCVAELTKNKGLSYLIEAAALIPKTNFYLIIIGEGEDKKKLEEKIKNLKLEDKVFLVGFLQEASKYLKAFDVFVLPSITEAGAYALHEAGYAALPVIATKVGGIPGIVKNGESGFLVPPKNPEALAETIKKLLDDKNLREQMGRKNYEIVSQKFSFKKMLKETIDIYIRV